MKHNPVIALGNVTLIKGMIVLLTDDDNRQYLALVNHAANGIFDITLCDDGSEYASQNYVYEYQDGRVMGNYALVIG